MNETADLDRAAAQLRAGNPGRAARLARRVLEGRPGHGRALHLLGAAQARQGDLRGAIASLRASLNGSPGSRAAAADLAAVWLRESDRLFAAGEDRRAREAQRHAVRADPFFSRMRDAIGAAAAGRPRDAETAYREILKQDPAHIHALVGLANIAIDRNAPDDAERLLQRAMAASPNMSHVHRALSRLAMARSLFAEAEAAARRAVDLDPDLAESWTSLGTVLAWGLRQADAAEAFSRALEIDPNQPRVLLSLGHVHKALGNSADSVRAYRASAAADPGLGEAWWSLADLKTYRFGDDEVGEMRSALGKPSLFGRDRAALHFALGKALEDRGEADDAFAHYRQGNDLRREHESFDVGRFEAQCRRLRATFSPGLLAAKRRDASAADPVPVFVVGLPRSGSTLVDQILSSHSRVRGTMELPHVLGYVRELERGSAATGSDPGAAGDGYPGCVAAMAPERFEALGRRYLAETAAYRGDAPWFVDKMPNNFLHIGLIACMLPQAVFVDTRRHPLACAFSIYKQNFARGQAFGYGFDSLAAYYRNYVAMMAHWEEALPGRVHRVVYERMVDHTEGETRRLLRHCGLDFEPACLRFFETDRVVRTASAEQVRQPIYSDAKTHWRAFERHLEPLAEALGEVMETWERE